MMAREEEAQEEAGYALGLVMQESCSAVNYKHSQYVGSPPSTSRHQGCQNCREPLRMWRGPLLLYFVYCVLRMFVGVYNNLAVFVLLVVTVFYLCTNITLSPTGYASY
jgi:hypothetical protein